MQETPTQTTTKSAPNVDAPNYLAAFLLTLFLGFIGTNRLYTGHRLLGWLRAVMFVAVFVAPVFFLVDTTTGIIALSLGAVANAAATLWWYIDLWLYFTGNVHDRKTGQPLHRDSPRDYSVARSMMLSLHLAVVALVVLVSVGIGLLVNNLQNGSLLKMLQPGGDTTQIQQLLKTYGG